MPAHLLSKSKYIRGLQCERALWLDVYRPRLARYTREQRLRFDRGKDFEYSFKALFADGVDVSMHLGRKVDEYPTYTANLLDGGSGVVIFEAGFMHDDVLVLADVVRQREDDSLDIYEVKSGTALSETYKRDAAVQYYVISNCRKIASFCIVHAKLGEHTDSESEDNMPFVTVDLTDELREQTSTVAANIMSMKEILAHGEPDTPTGQHCLVPYACPYQHYCRQGVRQLALF